MYLVNAVLMLFIDFILVYVIVLKSHGLIISPSRVKVYSKQIKSSSV